MTPEWDAMVRDEYETQKRRAKQLLADLKRLYTALPEGHREAVKIHLLTEANASTSKS